MTDVLTPQLLHQLRGHAGIEWCQQEVNVIVHEHVGVKKATRVQQRVAEQMQITLPVGVIEKAGEAIVTPAARCAEECWANRVEEVGP
ncbi:hypothetical protein [Burkholderia cepacia]|uniref:hypothetical protein n=1 Tax=Burkholderia cepacia TaxID=292 RepID=UPI0007535471|nr:hypothetical protein [Burkholderia cepacia]KVS73425.1 hypothetical protein WK41_09975 [Burkholderia cepacia]